MKNENRHDLAASGLLTVQALQQLKDRGFRFVQVKGYTRDKRLDYIDPRYLLLVPVKDLPAAMHEKEIYEPINSPLLSAWAHSPHEGVEVLIARIGQG